MALRDQIVKLEAQTAEFEANIKRLQGSSREEMGKTLRAGLSALASSAARNTPPDIGRTAIRSERYEDGVSYNASARGKTMGRRRIYDLLSLARDPDTGHYRRRYGRLLQQGYYYVVSIFRQDKPLKQIPCRSYQEACHYAHITYRGLTRAAWGMNIKGARGKMPVIFRKLLSLRPGLSKQSHLNVVSVQDGEVYSGSVTNKAIPAGASFALGMEAAAQVTALRTMNDRMKKFFKKEREL